MEKYTNKIIRFVKMQRVSNLLALMVFFSCFLSSATPQKLSTDENPFPKPDGPYQVGTTNYFWIDKIRDEIFTKDKSDKRHLLVQVWYPAQIIHSENFSPYILNPQEFSAPTQQIKDMFPIKTNAILNAPIASLDYS
jgi:hypothetical protein